MEGDTLVLRMMLMAGLCVAIAGGIASILISLIRRRRRHLLTPGHTHLPIWNGFLVLLAVMIFVGFSVCLSIIQATLVVTGFFTRLYGADFPLELPATPSDFDKSAQTIRHLWSAAIFFPLQLAIVLLLPRLMRVRNPLHARNWSGSVVGGYLTWLIITPVAFCVFVLASLAHFNLTGRQPEKHPLTTLGDLTGHWELKALFVLQTVIIAPFLEEWLFRGVLLPWLAQRQTGPPTPYRLEPRYRPFVILGLALVLGTCFTFGNESRETVQAAFESDPQAVIAYIIPAAFFALLVPFDFLWPRMRRLRRHFRIRSRQEMRAVWASAALFAAVHAHVWPSPVPLLFLAVGLGYLYLRTRSLIGPIVVHGMFNAVSATYILLGGPS